MTTYVRIAWRPVESLSPAIAQDGQVIIGQRQFSVHVRPGRRDLKCIVDDGYIVASGHSMRECKAAIENIAHNRGGLLL